MRTDGRTDTTKLIQLLVILRTSLKSADFGVPVAAHAGALATNFSGTTDANHNTRAATPDIKKCERFES